MSSTVGPIAAQRARNARLTAQLESIAAAHAVVRGGAGPLPVVLLPANTRPLVPLPAVAREAFLAHLDEALACTFALPMRDTALAHGTDHADARADAGETASWDPALSLGIVGASCGTCGGSCCTAGGTHAFLQADSLVRVRAHRSMAGEDTPEAIRALYLAAMPARHYRDSCVFHAAQGCTLARDVRSNLCNRYQCGGLTQLSRAMARAGTTSAVVGAADREQLHRMAVVSDSGVVPIRMPNDVV
jgi:hypothetical protein